MFDWLRDLIKTDEVKRQEAITAYLDDILTPYQRKRFEKQVAEDSTLQREVESQLFIKENLGRLPRIDAPRSFTLDPEKYGEPERQSMPIFYPALRAATALAAIVFVLALVLDLFIIDGTGGLLQSTSTEESAVAFTADSMEEEAIEEAQEEIETAAGEPEEEAEEAAAAEALAVPAEAPVAEEAVEEPSEATPIAMVEVVTEGEEAAQTGPPEDATDEEAGDTSAQELGSDEIESEVPYPLSTAPAVKQTPEVATEDSPLAATADREAQFDETLESELSARSATTPAVSGLEPDLPSEAAIPSDEDGGVPPAETEGDRIAAPADRVSPIRLVEIVLGVSVALLATVTWLVRRRL